MHGAGILSSSSGYRHIGRFQRHATDRAGSWLGLDHLRIHRTDIFHGPIRVNRRRFRHSLLRRGQIILRVSAEFFQTPRGAEVVGLPLIIVCAGCSRRLHRHAAHRIDLARSGRLHHGKGLPRSGHRDQIQRLLVERLFGICPKSIEARYRTEIIGRAFVIVTPRRFGRLNRHSTDRIDGGRGMRMRRGLGIGGLLAHDGASYRRPPTTAAHWCLCHVTASFHLIRSSHSMSRQNERRRRPSDITEGA